MFLRNRSLLVKVVKNNKHEIDEKDPLNLGDVLNDVERVRDMAIETAATVAVIVAGVKIVDTICKIAVNLSARGLLR